MPYYRCELVSPLPMQTVLLRFQTLVRDEPGFLQSLKESLRRRPAGSPPFIGKVHGNVLHVHRDIRYRNSFLPQVRAAVAPVPNGTIVHVTMHLHPVVAVFMLIWLVAVGIGAIAAFAQEHTGVTSALIPAWMLFFGVVLTAGGFYPEAYKARRLLGESVGARVA